jgi:hypothetical protein
VRGKCLIPPIRGMAVFRYWYVNSLLSFNFEFHPSKTLRGTGGREGEGGEGRGREEGRERGRKEGRERGRKEGRKRWRRRTLIP